MYQCFNTTPNISFQRSRISLDLLYIHSVSNIGNNVVLSSLFTSRSPLHNNISLIPCLSLLIWEPSLRLLHERIENQSYGCKAREIIFMLFVFSTITISFSMRMFYSKSYLLQLTYHNMIAPIISKSAFKYEPIISKSVFKYSPIISNSSFK